MSRRIAIGAAAVAATGALVYWYRRRRSAAQHIVSDAGGVERSVEDVRQYRTLTLKGGIKALLVCDPQAESRSTAAMCVDEAGGRTAPIELVGLAHFLEHMLFLGSEKYPEESWYKKQVALHNGSSNAATSSDSTVFHFEVEKHGFATVLDVFAQFFAGRPLLNEGCSDREVQAVTAEDSRNRINDDRRRRVALQHTVAGRERGAHTWSKFGTGNESTLGSVAAAKAGVSVRAALLAYRQRFYRTDQMSLVIISADELDALEDLAVGVFGAGGGVEDRGGVSDVGVSVGDPGVAAAAERLIARAATDAEVPSPAHPWDDAATRDDPMRWPFELRIVPIKERRKLRLMWPMPANISQHRHPRSPAVGYLTHVLGHEGDGSLFACLQSEGLATSVGTATESGRDFLLFFVSIDLTVSGEENVTLVLRRTYEAIHAVAAAGAGPAAAAVWAEAVHTSALDFRYAERHKAAEEARNWAKRLHTYRGEHVLSGGHILDPTFPATAVLAILELMRPGNGAILRESKAFSQMEQAAGAEDDEGDSVCIVTPPPPLPPGAESLVEPYYGVEYERRPLDSAMRKVLEAARRGDERAPTVDGKAPPPLHVPAPNLYLASDFSMVACPAGDSAHGSSAPPSRLTPLPDYAGGRAVHWHATDVSFGKPKAHVIMSFAIAPEALRQTTNLTLWINILDQRLAVALYPAHLAGLRWSISSRTSGVVLRVYGFSDRLASLLLVLVEQLLQWDAAAYAALFEPKREALVRGLKSHYKARADNLALYHLNLLLCPDDVTVEDELRAANAVTMASLQAWHSTVLAKLALTTFTYGNVSERAASGLHKQVEAKIMAARAAALPRSAWDREATVKLPRPVGSGGWRLRLKPQSTDEKNSACVVYFQLGQLGIGVEKARLLMANRLLSQPLFAELRTKQQLGYAVHSGLYANGAGDAEISGVYVLVLSKDYTPGHLHAAIDAYMRDFAEGVIGQLTADEYATSRAALVTTYRQPARTLREAFDRKWAPIAKEHYDWERRTKLADLIEKLSLSEVKELAAQYVATAPRIAVYCYGNKHYQSFDTDDQSALNFVDIDGWEAWRHAQPTWPMGVA